MNGRDIGAGVSEYGLALFDMNGDKFRYLEPAVCAIHPILHGCYPLLMDLHFQWSPPGEKHFKSFKIDAGVAHDFATVPWPLRWYMGSIGPHATAAIIHDAAYINAKRVRARAPAVMHVWEIDRWEPMVEDLTLSQALADRLFFDAMEAVGGQMRSGQKHMAYFAVRNFGGRYFKSKLGKNNVIDMSSVMRFMSKEMTD